MTGELGNKGKRGHSHSCYCILQFDVGGIINGSGNDSPPVDPQYLAQHNFQIIRSCMVCFFFLSPPATGLTIVDPRSSSERESNPKVCG
ncbi:hypothetical protein AAES_102257 [Amazona aestiva]|uniref:Uncharacterized protein n=1 Tax=Amazona aestiva TaxID=12930 RepID=A0A0Q3MAX2_AMAAE|nr:hypothetical protein AAES_102257 [Amazona aestiva]